MSRPVARTVAEAGRSLPLPQLLPEPGEATPKGLDLNDPTVYALVRRMFYKRFSVRVTWAGLEEDDAFQEVCLRLLRRQQGKSRFDESRSSLSNYLFVAMTGITANLAEKSRCRVQFEPGETDAAETAKGTINPITDRTVDDLAAELELPRSVIEAMLFGDDPVNAALDAGMDVQQAMHLADELGVR